MAKGYAAHRLRLPWSTREGVSSITLGQVVVSSSSTLGTQCSFPTIWLDVCSILGLLFRFASVCVARSFCAPSCLSPRSCWVLWSSVSLSKSVPTVRSSRNCSQGPAWSRSLHLSTELCSCAVPCLYAFLSPPSCWFPFQRPSVVVCALKVRLSGVRLGFLQLADCKAFQQQWLCLHPAWSPFPPFALSRPSCMCQAPWCPGLITRATWCWRWRAPLQVCLLKFYNRNYSWRVSCSDNHGQLGQLSRSSSCCP